MNEDAIKDAYDLFVNTGYNKSYDNFKALESLVVVVVSTGLGCSFSMSIRRKTRAGQLAQDRHKGN